MDDNSVEEKIIKVFEKVSCNIDSSNIEVCHRITQRNDRVNVRFSRRKDCQRKLSVKKILQKLKMEGIGLAGDNKVFINHSLCPYYRVLWSKTKVLFSMGKINRLMVSNRTVKAKISEISAPISITHSDGFTKYFPDIDLSDDFENFCNNFELTLDAVLPTNPFLIHSIGDFNPKSSNWYTGDTTTFEGSEVEAITFQFRPQQIINEPTHIQGESASCIDLIFSSQPDLVMSSGIYSSLHQNCHHQILFAKFSLKAHYPPPYEHEVWHFKKANTDHIKRAINGFPWERSFANVDINDKVDNPFIWFYKIFP